MSYEKNLIKINPFRTFNYDLVVIGASEFGLACAKEAAKNGARVCVISQGNFCEDILEKNFHQFFHKCVQFKYIFRKAKNFGFSWKLLDENQKKESILWSIMKEKLRYASDFRTEEYTKSLIDDQIHYVQSNENIKFIDEHHVLVPILKNEIYYGENFVISPTIKNSKDIQFPYVIGAEEFGILSTDLKNIKNLNGSTLIFGSGRNALSLAAALSNILNDITLMCEKFIIQNCDQQMINLFIDCCHFKYLPKCSIYHLKQCLTKNNENKIQVYFTQLSAEWRQIKFYDRVIFTPDFKNDMKFFINQIENIKFDRKFNFCNKKSQFRTNFPHIYVFNENENFDFNPEHIGKILARFIFSKEKQKSITDFYDKNGFIEGPTDYSFVGMNENEASQKFGVENIEIYQHCFKSCEYPLFLGCTKNFIKVICMKDCPKKILGMHLLAPNAGNIIQGYAAALRCGIFLNDLIHNAAVYPTLSWEFTQLKIRNKEQFCKEHRTYIFNV